MRQVQIGTSERGKVLCLLCRAGEQQKKATGTRLINRSGISGGLLRGDRGRSGRGGGEHLSVCLVSAVCLSCFVWLSVGICSVWSARRKGSVGGTVVTGEMDEVCSERTKTAGPTICLAPPATAWSMQCDRHEACVPRTRQGSNSTPQLSPSELHSQLHDDYMAIQRNNNAIGRFLFITCAPRPRLKSYIASTKRAFHPPR
jgi:hypothetical protein